jgi:hypothetical protein
MEVSGEALQKLTAKFMYPSTLRED